MVRPIRSCRAPAISAMMLPELGRSIPMMYFIKVDLPLPCVPSNTTVSACDTDTEMSSIARTSP